MHAPTASSELFANLADDVVASGSATTPVPTPSTGEVLHELPRSSADDVREAVARARLAQLAWARAGFAERRRVLLRAHDLLISRGELLLDLVQLESGKTRGQAVEELFEAAAVTRYNALSAKRVLRGRSRRAGVPLASTTRVRYRPKGVAGVITPWNYALSLAAMDVVPALAAGCAVVQKADDQGALSHPRAAPGLHRRGRARGGLGGRRRSGRRGRRGAHRPGRLHLLHGLHGHRPPDRREGRSAPRRRLARARRQEPDARARRRRPRAGRRGCRVRVLLGHGPAVRLDRAHLRAPRGRRAVHDRARRATRIGDPRFLAGLRERLRLARDARRSSSASRGTSTTRSRRAPRCSSAVGRVPTSGPGSSSRRCSPASRPRCASTRTRRSAPLVVALRRRQRGGGDPRRQRERVRAQRVGARLARGGAAAGSPTHSRPAASTSTRATAARSARSTPRWAA